MASPQKENGYTAIANELLDRLVNTSLLGSEFQVVFFLLRKTYGFQKKKDIISLSQFQKGTGLSRPTVVKSIKNLMARNIIVKVVLPDENIEYSFQKDHDKWVVNTTLLVKQNAFASKDVFTKTSKDVFTYKRNKENTKETSKTIVLQGSQWNELIDLFKDVNPMFASFYSNKSERKALEDLVKTLGFEKVKTTISQLAEITSMPYAPKITKPTELKRDLGKLVSFYNQTKNKLLANSKGIA